MIDMVPPAVQQQINRVHRRLLLQTLLDRVVWCVALALVLAAVTLLILPHLAGKIGDEVRWYVASGFLGAGLVIAVVLGVVQAPSRLAAALALDHQFGLKERVTTTLMLTSEQSQTPAGQALLADVQEHVNGVQVSSRFPVRLAWSSAVMPLCAALLVAAAFVYDPDLTVANPTNNNNDKLAASEAKDIEQKLQELKKQVVAKPQDTEKSEKLKELEAELAKLLDQPLDPRNKDELRERAQELRNLEEKFKNRAADLKARLEGKDALKKALEKLAVADPKGKLDPKEGPTKDLFDALSKGDMKKAREELEKLAKKMSDGKMDQKEMKKLQDQLGALQQRLQRLAERAERADQLRKENEAGNLSDEELKKALDQLERESQDLSELDELAKALDQCKACMERGDFSEAAKRLARMARELKDFELIDDELDLLRDELNMLEECRNGMCNRITRRPNGTPGGPRPPAKEHETKSELARQSAKVDRTGKMKITGFTRGGNFSRIPSQEIPAAFRQTAQEAQEAIERQRVDPAAAETLKGYFQNLGGQR